MDPNDSYMKIESLDSRLDELTRRRKLLEQRSEMRRRTMEEFEILRKQSQQRLAKSLEQQNEEARKRNSTLISKYNESSRISQEQIRMKKLLQKEKEKYLKHVETMQPLWHRCQAIKLEEKIMQLKDEKLQSIKRKEKLKMELLREEKMRFGLEQQRRELLIQLAVEQKELMEIKANSIYHTEEGKHIENIILSKMERVNEELKMLISNNLERVKSLNLDVPYPEEQVYFREYSDMEVYNINKEMSRIIEENKNSNNNSDNDRQRRALNDERLRRLSDQINQFTQNDSSMNNNTTYGGSNSYNNSAGGGGRMDDRYLAINNDRVVKNSQNYTKIDRNSQPGSESEAVEISVPLKKNLTRSNSVRFEEPVSSRVDKVNSNISEAVITEKVIRPEEFAIQKSTEPLERTDSFSLKSDSEESLAIQLNKKQDSPRKTTDNARDQTLINRIISRTASDYSIDEFDGANSNNNANGNTTNQVYHPNVPLDESNTSITGLSKIGSNKLATRSIDDDFIFNPAPIGGINAVSPSKSQDSIINSMPDSSVKETESPAKSVDEFEVVEERPLVSSSEELNQYVRNMKNSECVRLLKTVCGPLESKLMGGTIAADEVYKAVPTENGKSITVPHARRVYDYLVSLNGQENNAEIIDSIDIGMMGNIVMSIAIHKSTELIPM